MDLDNSDDRVYAAERILKKRTKKVSMQMAEMRNINIRTQKNRLLGIYARGKNIYPQRRIFVCIRNDAPESISFRGRN